MQGLSEEVETACVHNSFKNVGCEGELEGHRVEGRLSSFAKIGKTRGCLFAARTELSGRERLEQGKGEGMSTERFPKKGKEEIKSPNMAAQLGGQVRTCTGLWGLRTAAPSHQWPV